MIENLTEPHQSWITYPVTILQGADDFEQGKRRLNRAFIYANVVSTAAEETNDASTSDDDETEREGSETDSNEDYNSDESKMSESSEDLEKRHTRDQNDNNKNLEESRKRKNKFDKPNNKSPAAKKQKLGEQTSNHFGNSSRSSRTNIGFDLLLEEMQSLKKEIQKEGKKIRSSMNYDLTRKFGSLAKDLANNGVETSINHMEDAKKVFGTIFG
ncbi:uncharacterized protein LOC122512029 [Leptopilina heterotoma]|uniref:uncharacterized protein LOC122512029 n=1 Tax=Leptopilina heterotoma TaxID=63436 RepID=UPI001CA9F56C|nr:uncharacterized protein LOC122512029 [Leptopilina heterotoma]